MDSHEADEVSSGLILHVAIDFDRAALWAEDLVEDCADTGAVAAFSAPALEVTQKAAASGAADAAGNADPSDASVSGEGAGTLLHTHPHLRLRVLRLRLPSAHLLPLRAGERRRKLRSADLEAFAHCRLPVYHIVGLTKPDARTALSFAVRVRWLCK